MDETILAYRAWRVLPDGQLTSVAMRSYRWTPGKTMRADCTKVALPVPHEKSHPCGLHAWKSKELAVEYAAAESRRPPYAVPNLSPVAITGVVELGGTVWEHENGYRAASGLPVALIGSDNGLADLIAEAAGLYGIPVLRFEEA